MLLFGAPGSGKTCAVHAIAASAGAVIVDLSPAKLDSLPSVAPATLIRTVGWSMLPWREKWIVCAWR